MTPLGKTLGSVLKNLGRQNRSWMYVYNILDAALPVVLLFLATMALAGNSYNPFIYYQF